MIDLDELIAKLHNLANLKEFVDDALAELLSDAAEAIETLLDRVEKAEQAIARVREQHQVDEYTAGHTIVRCVCEEMWPCSTIKALEGDE